MLRYIRDLSHCYAVEFNNSVKENFTKGAPISTKVFAVPFFIADILFTNVMIAAIEAFNLKGKIYLPKYKR